LKNNERIENGTRLHEEAIEAIENGVIKKTRKPDACDLSAEIGQFPPMGHRIRSWSCELGDGRFCGVLQRPLWAWVAMGRCVLVVGES
jgi:hypothetical protein